MAGCPGSASRPQRWRHCEHISIEVGTRRHHGPPRYVHDPEVFGKTGTCICAACELELTPVLAGQQMRARPTGTLNGRRLPDIRPP